MTKVKREKCALQFFQLFDLLFFFNETVSSQQITYYLHDQGNDIA